MIGRRRFLAITAGAMTAPIAAASADAKVWRGIALGAEAVIALDHPEAGRLIEAARREIDRMEDIFSLYRADSALAQLNKEGQLDAPPPELLQVLAACHHLHANTSSAFDPTIQTLWTLYAQRYAAGARPTAEEIGEALNRTGFDHVRFDPAAVWFARDGMALSFNGIAQGYIADQVAVVLRRGGVGDVLIHTGETVALGSAPEGAPWRIGVPSGVPMPLSNAALASSDTQGTLFGEGKAGHILDPRTGRPAEPRSVSVISRTGLLADALSTAFCLTSSDITAACLSRYRASLLPVTG